MLYTRLVSTLFRWIYGEPSEPLEDSESGVVFVADGCGGVELCEWAVRQVVRENGGTLRAIPVCWTHGFGHWHADLTDVANHEAQAEALARQVMLYREQHPDRPIFLVGKSGGTWIVTRTLEQLPEATIDTAVMLAPAIAPGYDLTNALNAIRDELVVFWSPLDMFILGVGTWLFGTANRVRSVSAGLVGFRIPNELSERQRTRYARLKQIRWKPRMARSGYLGGHVGPDSPAFLRKYVMPHLTGVRGAEMLNFSGDQARSTSRR